MYALNVPTFNVVSIILTNYNEDRKIQEIINF